MSRQEANLKILELLLTEVKANPDLRLNQILINRKLTKVESGSYYQQTHNTVDYYEEPMVTLSRMVGNND